MNDSTATESKTLPGSSEQAPALAGRDGDSPRVNPFFEPYNTPHDTPPFDRIRLEDYEEAFMEGIRRDNELIDRIVNNPAKPTFDNTIVDQESDTEDYYDLLGRVSSVFFNLLSAETTDEMDALAQKMQPILTQHANDVRLNPKLFERVKHVHLHHRRLTPEEKMLLDNCYMGFVRSGALLSEEGKERLRRLTEEASMLSLQFSQNVLKEHKAYRLRITDPAQLEGLPQTAIDAAAEEAKGEGGWTFTLDSPSYSPFMTYCKDRELRRQMYMAYNTQCIHDNDANNLEICRRLVNLRREIAQLLGYKTYADYVLKHRMAGSVRGVYKLLNELIDAYKPTAIKERKEIENATILEPWDVAFYSHKLKLKKYNIDAEMLRPYLQLEKVIDGVFGLAHRLYGITFRENKDIPVYHPDVRAYEVFDKDGSYLAVFYADFHPRKGKQGGAWMTQYQSQCIDKNGVNIRPHVSVVMNLTKPTDGKPARRQKRGNRQEKQDETAENAWVLYEHSYYDGTNEIEGFVFDLEQPTISVWNGAAFHSDIFLFSEQAMRVNPFALQNMDLFSSYVRSSGVWGRGTNVGRALDTVLAASPSVLTPNTVLLILSDAKSVGLDRAEASLIRASKAAGSVVWMNPIPEAKWPYLKGVTRLRQHCSMVPCGTLDELSRACARLI